MAKQVKQAKETINLDKLFHKIEAVIARDLVDRIVKKGYAVDVWNGENYEIRKSTKKSAILKAMATTDEEILHLHKDGAYVGSIVLIYGNGEDLISDQHAHDDERFEIMSAICDEVYKKFNL